MGIECGDEYFREKYLNRRMSNERIKDAFARVKNADIFVTSYNMIGFPFENDSYLTEKTVELNKEIQPDYAQFSIFYPFPGTELYEFCLEKDLIDEDKKANTKQYFSESILKGFNLKNKIREINLTFNPDGFQFHKVRSKTFFAKIFLPVRRSLRFLLRRLPEPIQSSIKSGVGRLRRWTG